jgi:hypothetical protein
MFTLEESAHLRRMIRAVFVGLFLIAAAAVYYFLFR